MGLLDILLGRRGTQLIKAEEYPTTYQWYTINYSDQYWDPCPYHKCTTYQTVEERMYCYCPKCKKLLHHY